MYICIAKIPYRCLAKISLLRKTHGVQGAGDELQGMSYIYYVCVCILMRNPENVQLKSSMQLDILNDLYQHC